MVKAECPEEIQERLTEIVGTNVYGQPNFLIVWSQSQTCQAGGIWPHDQYAGYRQVYTANGSPNPPLQGYWMILEWMAPATGEGVYRFLNRDDSGLLTLGHFEHSGNYQIALKLQSKEIVNGTLQITSLPLTGEILDFVAPVILAAKHVSIEKRQMQARVDRARMEERQHKTLEAVAHDVRAPWHGATAASFAGQKNRNVAVAQRMDLIERQWNWALKNIKQVRKGFGTGAFAS
jgi:hypothetical protein